MINKIVESIINNYLLIGGDYVMEKKLKIIIENCPQNHKCPAVKVCPVGALSQEEFEAPKIDYEKCIKCGKCSNFCPKKALVLENLK